jgi:RecB family exonuclease
MFINRLSPSKLKCYNDCKLKYKLRYIDYLDEDFNPNTNTDALQYGSYIHKIFEDGNDATTIEELQTIAADLRDSYHFGPEKDKNTQKNLRNFLALQEKLRSKCEDVSTEMFFAVEVGDDITLNGIIDRIVKNEKGEYLVIDYKTSKQAISKMDMFKDPQMIIYAFAIHKMFNVPYSKIRVAHYYPHLDKIVDLTYTSGHININIKKALKKVWDIRKRKKDDFFAEPNRYCRWCGYYDICPKGNGSEQLLQETVMEHKEKKKAEKAEAKKKFPV